MSLAAVRRPSAAQHVHAFVEGCTCGAGIAGCCPCAVGAAAPHAGGPSARPHHGRAHRPGPAAPHAQGLRARLPTALSGGVAVAGMAMGVRAFVLNGQAQRRVQESLRGISAQLLDIEALLQANRAAAAAPADGSDEPSAPWPALARQRQRLLGLERQLRRSAQERRFERWVPGALQAAASACVLGALLPAAWSGLGHAVWVGAASCLWGAFGACYAWQAFADAFGSLLDHRALHRLPQAEAHEDRRELRSLVLRVRSQALWHAGLKLLEGVAWSVFAGGTAGSLTSAGTLLGIAVAANVGVPFGTLLAATGAGATLLSACLRRPSHTLTLPALQQMPVDASGTALAQLSARAWRKQEQALRGFVRQATGEYGWAAASLRLSMGWQAATRPACGPAAFRAVADRAARAARDEPLGEQALAAAVVRVLQAELSVLRAWRDAPAAAPLPAPAEGAQPSEGIGREWLEAEALAQSAFERRRPGHLRERARLLEQLIGQWELRRRRLPPGAANASEAERRQRRRQWRHEGADLRLATLLACGLLGEALLPFAGGHAPQAGALPGLTPLPHQHAEPTEAHWPAIEAALAPKVEHLFVRLFCNPHRFDEALAAGDRELAALARFGADVPQAPRRARACGSC